MTDTPETAAQRVELEKHLSDQCNRYVNGHCMTRNCLVRGGWKPGESQELATCEAHETLLLIQSHAQEKAELERKLKQSNFNVAVLQGQLSELVKLANEETKKLEVKYATAANELEDVQAQLSESQAALDGLRVLKEGAEKELKEMRKDLSAEILSTQLAYRRLREALTGVVLGKHNPALQDIEQLTGGFVRSYVPEAIATSDWFKSAMHYVEEIEKHHLPTIKQALSAPSDEQLIERVVEVLKFYGGNWEVSSIPNEELIADSGEEANDLLEALNITAVPPLPGNLRDPDKLLEKIKARIAALKGAANE
jgi:hypothetical protein